MKYKKLILMPDIISSPKGIESNILCPQYELMTPNAKNTSNISDEIWRKAVGILAWHELQYPTTLIEKLDNCKVIVRVGVGYDNIDLTAAKKKGIVVCNVPDYGTEDVADHAMAFLLALRRGIKAYNQQIKDTQSWSWQDAGELHRLSGQNVGIIGLGRIGTAFALRAKAFRTKISFYDPYVVNGQDKALGLHRCSSLEELLVISDIVSIHTPLTKETRGMAGSEFFSTLKKGAIFINTARGSIVDLDAMYKSLKSNRLTAAGLDVLPEEPPRYDHPLISAWEADEKWIKNRLLISPHSAFYNEESFIEMRVKAAKEILRVLNGEQPLNRV